MTNRTCKHCGTELVGKQRVACSRACIRKYHQSTRPELHKAQQARYRASAKGKAAKRTYRVERTCEVCGNVWLTENRKGKYCTNECKGRAYSALRTTRCKLPADHPVRLEIKRMRDVARKVKVKAEPVRPVWVSGPCGWCGEPFTTYTFTGARYCTQYCGKKAGKARRRAREANADGTYTWAEVTRKWIDIGKRCAYCDEPKRNDEIEPDHVEPLSRGGSNSIVNIVPSCHPCNGDKRDLALSEWYADRERRGLEPRVLNALLERNTPLVIAA